MLVLLSLHLALALIAPLLVRWWGRRACYPLALAPAATFGWAVAQTGTVRDGGSVTETYGWVSQLHLELALRVDTLSWLMLLLVGGVGALVLVYCAHYFAADSPGLGRFAATFVGFAGAMLGLVVTDNLVLLYVFWELTTVCSYLLIGQHPEKWASRRAASQALVVTSVGGLAMLIGLIMLGEHAGTYRISELGDAPLPTGGSLTAVVVLILVGALTKSAIFPVSFWLPAAMAAPTPVSAYLHAAAMVKAGVYLVALLAPLLATATPWRPMTLVAGIVTMLAGGWAALRQTDLKLLLAYGTVSQLGLLFILTGAGTRDAALAGTAMLLAHALFKSALFLVVGIVDHGAGTRELPSLSGLWRRMPLVCAAAVLAAASMAGLPPLIGFVAKEALFEAFRHNPLLLATLVAGATLTVAYSLRFLWGAFAGKTGQPPTPTRPVAPTMLAPVALLALAGLVTGVLAGPVDILLVPYAGRFGPGKYHLGIWHGPGLAVGLSLLALVGGGLLFALRDRLAPIITRLHSPFDGAAAYERITYWLDRVAVEVTGATQRGSLPQYLGTILVVLVVVPGGALLLGSPWPERITLWQSPVQLVIAGVLATAAILTVRARRRLTAMILVGVTGYGTAMMFVLNGAPDLALTQFLVETVSIVMFVLVLRRLPANFSARPLRRSRWLRVAIGTAVGLVMTGLALAAAGGRQAVPISVDFAELAVSYGHGRNIVNVTLVDIRAWDTMGEIAVLVVAATGVASLIFQRPRAGPGPRRPNVGRRAHSRSDRRRERVWLRAGPTLRDRRRSIVFEVVTRLIFHTIVLFSLYLVFSGHNAPGGGFSGGLVAGLALAVRYFAGGRYELDEAAPVDAGLVLGAGLFVSVGAGVLALLLGVDVLQSAVVDLVLPVVGEVHLVTSLFFDLGVYLIVVGLVLDVLRSLGAEVDRQIEAGIGPETELEPLRERELT
ncbi:multisubunit sodium/proton antiporter MrpA subunit /multisubunit sodium/proton antiporter MrpB subunit [Micromonospora pisi]|uniref:Multisubunit sodium/proton antiporter MrpA subunit /multisubunit sodium/proton antiporter MrpB subunit n=1 Tax=Micromonospora pisi TaxID=589240 RepID=A0A495JPE4_9ACTN|nr:Na+/H+ antiporter subunit A [Micromonospora pisi]RKR90870.1 multisubunit sodium/proton antiporter MrpA subunit /multisubunit sodium/proton antiporter MrpB subunit [Micromonospora pisi]